MSTIIPSGWLPVKLHAETGYFSCNWFYFNDKPFSEPFFTETMRQCQFLIENAGFNRPATTLEQLREASSTISAVSAGAIIFHVSRCGSTLVSQSLSLMPENIVLSEVPFFDDILRIPFNQKILGWSGTTDDYFKAAVKFHAQSRLGREKRFVIKTDSWHLMFYDQFRRMYPGVPFIIMYRSPDEIIRSQKKMRGMQSVPGMIELNVFGLTESDITYDLDQFMSRVLEKYYQAILEILSRDSSCLVINYNEGIETIMDKVFRHTAIEPSHESISRMKERQKFHGKYPGQLFQVQEANENPPPFLDKCFSLYHLLEEKRLSREPVVV